LGSKFKDFLQNLFGAENETNMPTTNKVAPISSSVPSQMPPLPPGLHVGKKTDIGRQRENNQDALYTITSFIHSNETIEPFGVFIVADGMGGYKGGEKASAIAIKTAANHILQNIYLPDLVPNAHKGSYPPLNEILISAVNIANTAVLDAVPESGTTLTITVVIGNQAYFAHVGDSRAYIYHDGKLQQITQDHSLVARMVELGQVTAQEALTHQHRNVLYRAVGQSSTLEVETYFHPLPSNSYLFICSDGLWGLVSDEEISQILASATSLDDGVNKLIDMANNKGGDDNITAILVSVGI
jgi:serine/threonine protein phosphatase PrpC